MVKGKLFYNKRMVISSTSAIIPKLLEEFHSSPSGGHSGFLCIYKRLAANLHWQGMKKRILDFIKACDTCQRQKYLATNTYGLLQPLPTLDQVWVDISMVFIVGLPKS